MTLTTLALLTHTHPHTYLPLLLGCQPSYSIPGNRRVAALLAKVRSSHLGRSGSSASLSLSSSADRLAATATPATPSSPNLNVGRLRTLAGIAETSAGRARLSKGRGIAEQETEEEQVADSAVEENAPLLLDDRDGAFSGSRGQRKEPRNRYPPAGADVADSQEADLDSSAEETTALLSKS